MCGVAFHHNFATNSSELRLAWGLLSNVFATHLLGFKRGIHFPRDSRVN